MIFARGGQITVDSLPAEIRDAVGTLNEQVPLTKGRLAERKGKANGKILDLERNFLLNLIEKSGGNISEAARDRNLVENPVGRKITQSDTEKIFSQRDPFGRVPQRSGAATL